MSVSNWLNVILGVIVGLLLTVLVFANERIKYYDTEYQALSEKIDQLEVDAQNAQERYKQAQRDADVKMQKSAKETRKIVLAKVPAECDKAIKWAIDEAKVFAT